MTTYCAICGGPIFKPDMDSPVDWLRRAILLHSEDDTGLKERKGPMIVKRGSDGRLVKLVCLGCRRSDFNSAQGFISHCRIVHSRQFASPDAAIEASGQEIEFKSSVLELPATNKGGPFFELFTNKQPVMTCDTGVRFHFVNPRPPLYIPSHAACIQIAYQVCATSNKFMSESDSLRHIWNVLKARFYASSEKRRVPSAHLHEPNDFRGWLSRFQGVAWERGEHNYELNHEAQHFEADPIEIPEVTTSILSHLQLVPQMMQPPSSHSVDHNPKPTSAKLPPEIIYNIIDQLGALSDPSLDCTSLIDPSGWRLALLDNVLLPWLPLLDARMLVRKEASLPLGQKWNWELLVRQLAQSDIYQPRRVLHDLPLGLRNRKRIWRLVEDILATDVP